MSPCGSVLLCEPEVTAARLACECLGFSGHRICTGEQLCIYVRTASHIYVYVYTVLSVSVMQAGV